MTGRELLQILESNNLLDRELIIACEGYVIDENDEVSINTTTDGRVLLHDSCGYYDEAGII